MRILFVSNPLRGHVNTLLPLALAALRAGHDVVFASGSDMRQTIERHGVTASPVGQTHDELGGSCQESWLDYFVRSASGRAIDLLPRASAWAPELVIHEDTDFAGAIVAARCGGRPIVHGQGMMPSSAVWTALSGRLDQLGSRFGVPDLAKGISGATYLEVCPPALRNEGALVWRQALPLRHCAGLPSDGQWLPDALDALPYRETIHLTLGTVFNAAAHVLQAAIEGLRALPFNLVVTIGPGADRERFGPQPAHVVLEPYLPHVLLLPRCRLVVSHGGAGALLGALAHGLPLLLLPQGGDQFGNAQASERAGVALVLAAQQVSAANVRAAALRLLGEAAFTRAARVVQSEIATMPSAERMLPALTASASARAP